MSTHITGISLYQVCEYEKCETDRITQYDNTGFISDK